ncbi:hypothetical protein AK812_SmicGene26243 [Symbiodinium microadriaticum]|uniref:HEAT repeat domain-containing protein n=1 Tax=Symbiodinium microadriaticum TaxID=2951 RepID=A0A1Q9D9X2_SYMMI|nr:hypothetical protein AK812_SmicGene26243 [Symbiodinium microadriaticum]
MGELDLRLGELEAALGLPNDGSEATTTGPRLDELDVSPEEEDVELELRCLREECSASRLEDEDADVRAAASQAAGLLSNSVDDVRLLAPLLKDKNWRVAAASIDALEQISGGPSGLPILVRVTAAMGSEFSSC